MKCGFPTYAVRTLHPEWTWLDLSRKSLDPCTWSLFGEPCTWLLLHNCYDSVTTLWGLENLSPFHVRFEPSENWMCNVVSQSLLQRRRIFAGWNWGPWLKIPHQWTHKWSFCGPWTIQSWRLKIAVFWSKNKGIVSNPQKTPEIVRGSPGLIICHPSKTIPQIFPGIGSKIWNEFWWESDGFLYQTLSSFQAPHCLDPLDPLAFLISKIFQNGHQPIPSPIPPSPPSHEPCNATERCADCGWSQDPVKHQTQKMGSYAPWNRYQHGSRWIKMVVPGCCL